MQRSPFPLLAAFPELDVCILEKEDAIASDDATVSALGDGKIVSTDQVHGKTVRIVREAEMRESETHGPAADAIATDKADLWLTVRWGDCQNFVVYAPDKHVIATVHAGWKGLSLTILPALYEALKQEWNIEPKETWVGSGPSLCKKCADFTDPAKELPADWAPFIEGQHADLRAIAHKHLTDLGVRSERIDLQPDCTRCLPNRYWTLRGGHKAEMEKKLRNVLACRLRA